MGAVINVGHMELEITDKNGNPIAAVPVEGGIRVPLREAFIFGQPGADEALRDMLKAARVE